MSIFHKKKKIFYGWWIVAACFFISMYVSASVTFGFTALFDPIVQEFGWTYAQVAFASSLRGIEAGIFAPLVGVFVDRWGPRKLIIAGAVVTGCAMLMFSRIHSLAGYYGVFILIGIGTSATTSVVTMTAVSNWFRKKMSLAVGIVVSGTGASGLLIPLLSSLIDKFQWRTTVAIAGIGMWCIVIPLALIVRHKPEQYGYFPDGIEGQVTVNVEDKTGNGGGKKAIPEILKNGLFWQIALVYMFSFLVVSSVVTHNMPYLGTIGIDRLTASMIAGAVPLFTIAGRFGFGWLGNRAKAKRLSMTASLFIMLGLLCYAYIGAAGTWLVVPFLCFFGLGYGGVVPMMPVLVREYIGLRHFGTTLGFVMGIMTIGQLVGPPLSGNVYDTLGSYQSVWLGFVVLMLGVMAGIIALPSKKENRDSA